MQVERTLVWYIQHLCGSGGSPLVCWHVTVDIELHTVFLQHNGLVHSREHRTPHFSAHLDYM